MQGGHPAYRETQTHSLGGPVTLYSPRYALDTINVFRYHCVSQTWIGEGGHEQKKTFLLDKKPNTLLGRKIMWVGVDDVTPEVRKRGRSSAKEIHVAGCQTISKTASTDTPGVLVTYTLSCL